MLEHVSFTKLPLQILEAGLVVDIKPLERVQSTRGRKGIRFTCCRNLNLPNLPLAQIHGSHFHEILGMSDSETAIKLEGNKFSTLVTCSGLRISAADARARGHWEAEA